MYSITFHHWPPRCRDSGRSTVASRDRSELTSEKTVQFISVLFSLDTVVSFELLKVMWGVNNNNNNNPVFPPAVVWNLSGAVWDVLGGGGGGLVPEERHQGRRQGTTRQPSTVCTRLCSKNTENIDCFFPLNLNFEHFVHVVSTNRLID